MKAPVATTHIQNQILGVLLNENDWMTRHQVAEKLGVRQLSSYQVLKLDSLVDKNLVERRQATVGLIKTRYEYRIKNSDQQEQ